MRDLDSGTDLFALRAGTARVPASVEKLYTTATALLRLGPAETLDTRAVSAADVDAGGVLRGNLVLVGGGDPFFGDESAAQLARAVKAAGVARIDGAVVGDESGFDRRRSSCCAGYDSDLGGVLSALAYNRGFFGGRPAARRGALRRDPLRRAAAPRRACAARASRARGSRRRRPARSRACESMPVRELIRFINVPSNNFAAEMLLKALGERYRDSGTTRDGAAVVRETRRGARRAGEGRGRVGPVALGSHEPARRRPAARAHGRGRTSARRSAPRSRSRAGRARSRAACARTPAAERCRVKTGTLRSVSALAGYCRTAGGRDIAFALMFNRASTYVEKAREDRIAAAIARLEGAPAAKGPAPSGGAGAPD